MFIQEYIKNLVSSYADEILAVSHYIMACLQTEDKKLKKEFMLHVMEELNHAIQINKLLNNLKELNVIHDQEINSNDCKFTFTFGDSSNFVKTSAKSEADAIKKYIETIKILKNAKNELINILGNDTGYKIYKLNMNKLLEILNDEIEHYTDMKESM